MSDIEARLLHAIFSSNSGDPREQLAGIAERVLESEVAYDEEDKYRFADAVLAAFPDIGVLPVPVYEYGVRYGDGTYARFAGTRAEAESKMSVKFGDRVVYRVAQIPAVPASEWELVLVNERKMK